MEEIGKTFVLLGALLLLIGFILVLISKFGSSIPLGKLPGDILIKRDNFVFYFPIGTSILLSVLLSLLFFLLTRKQ